MAKPEDGGLRWADRRAAAWLLRGFGQSPLEVAGALLQLVGEIAENIADNVTGEVAAVLADHSGPGAQGGG